MSTIPRPPLLTGRALALFERGLSVAQATDVARGACAVCLRWHGPKACQELRKELFKMSDDVPSDNPDVDSTPTTYGPEQL